MSWDYAVIEVVRVVDGDTIDLRIDLGFHLTATLRFRLLGVDTPERNEEGWAEASRFSKEWLNGKKVRIRTFKSDSFGRWLGMIYEEDVDYVSVLNEALIDSGHAVEYKR